MTLSFESDYTEGAHPLILQKLVETNLEYSTGYGNDQFCDSAKARIKAALKNPNAEVYFLVGGTQTNATIIDSMLERFEGVISAETGHINAHEAGAVESNGHKILPLPSHNGKIDAGELSTYLSNFFDDANHDHMIFPGMVYISFPTEYGTLYSKSELSEIYDICKKYEIKLFIDGARLGYGLMSKECDLTLPELSALCDAFYIGGTKVGALCGEAVVFPKKAPKQFFTVMKQHGALLAKGRLLGIQFDTLFTDDLYFKISAHAIDMAEDMKQIFTKHGLSFFMSSPTNQQFIILDDCKLKKLSEEIKFSFWEKLDENHTVVRFAASWATTKAQLDELDSVLGRLL